MQLGQDQDGGQRVNPAEASQPPHVLPMRLRLRDLCQPGVELAEARLEMIDGAEMLRRACVRRGNRSPALQ